MNKIASYSIASFIALTITNGIMLYYVNEKAEELITQKIAEVVGGTIKEKGTEKTFAETIKELQKQKKLDDLNAKEAEEVAKEKTKIKV